MHLNLKHDQAEYILEMLNQRLRSTSVPQSQMDIHVDTYITVRDAMKQQEKREDATAGDVINVTIVLPYGRDRNNLIATLEQYGFKIIKNPK